MLYIDLQLFADGAAAAGEGTAAAQGGFDFETEFQKQFGRPSGLAAPEKQAEPETQTDADARTDGYRAQGQDASAEKQPRDLDKDFDELIKGEFREQYGKRVQAAVNDRFKTNNAKLAAAEQRARDILDAVDPYLDKLGVDKTDLKAIKAAALEDRTNFRAMAAKNNTTVEEAMTAYQEAREKARQQESATQQQQAAAQAQAQAQQAAINEETFRAWKADEAEIQKTDPDFALAKALKEDPDFRRAVNAGLPVAYAYKASNYDRRMAQVAGAVEQQTALRTAQSIAANRARPPEGGLGSNPAQKAERSYKDMPDNDFRAMVENMLKQG